MQERITSIHFSPDITRQIQKEVDLDKFAKKMGEEYGITFSISFDKDDRLILTEVERKEEDIPTHT